MRSVRGTAKNGNDTSNLNASRLSDSAGAAPGGGTPSASSQPPAVTSNNRSGAGNRTTDARNNPSSQRDSQNGSNGRDLSERSGANGSSVAANQPAGTPSASGNAPTTGLPGTGPPRGGISPGGGGTGGGGGSPGGGASGSGRSIASGAGAASRSPQSSIGSSQSQSSAGGSSLGDLEPLALSTNQANESNDDARRGGDDQRVSDRAESRASSALQSAAQADRGSDRSGSLDDEVPQRSQEERDERTSRESVTSQSPAASTGDASKTDADAEQTGVKESLRVSPPDDFEIKPLDQSRLANVAAGNDDADLPALSESKPLRSQRANEQPESANPKAPSAELGQPLKTDSTEQNAAPESAAGLGTQASAQSSESTSPENATSLQLESLATTQVDALEDSSSKKKEKVSAASGKISAQDAGIAVGKGNGRGNAFGLVKNLQRKAAGAMSDILVSEAEKSDQANEPLTSDIVGEHEGTSIAEAVPESQPDASARASDVVVEIVSPPTVEAPIFAWNQAPSKPAQTQVAIQAGIQDSAASHESDTPRSPTAIETTYDAPKVVAAVNSDQRSTKSGALKIEPTTLAAGFSATESTSAEPTASAVGSQIEQAATSPAPTAQPSTRNSQPSRESVAVVNNIQQSERPVAPKTEPTMLAAGFSATESTSAEPTASAVGSQIEQAATSPAPTAQPSTRNSQPSRESVATVNNIQQSERPVAPKTEPTTLAAGLSRTVSSGGVPAASTVGSQAQRPANTVVAETRPNIDTTQPPREVFATANSDQQSFQRNLEPTALAAGYSGGNSASAEPAASAVGSPAVGANPLSVATISGLNVRSTFGLASALISRSESNSATVQNSIQSSDSTLRNERPAVELVSTPIVPAPINWLRGVELDEYASRDPSEVSDPGVEGDVITNRIHQPIGSEAAARGLSVAEEDQEQPGEAEVIQTSKRTAELMPARLDESKPTQPQPQHETLPEAVLGDGEANEEDVPPDPEAKIASALLGVSALAVPKRGSQIRVRSRRN